MERVTKTDGQIWPINQAGIVKGTKTEALKKEENTPRTDNVEWSSQVKGEDWDQMVSDVINKIKQLYPNINITMAGAESGKNSGKEAALLGKGKHIVISKEFIERMTSSRDEFGKCCAALSGAAKQLAGQNGGNFSSGVYLRKDQAVFWSVSGRENQEQKKETLYSMMKKKEDEVNPMKKFSRLSATTTVSTSGNYSKVAGAKNKSQVQQAMGDVQRDIGSLKMVACFGDSEEQVKARRAIKSLQKLLARGSRKIQRMNKEQLKQSAQKRAHKEMQRRKEEQIRLELKKMQTSRKCADHALIKEGKADEAYIRGYRQYKKVSSLYQEALWAEMASIPGENILAGDIAAGNIQPGDFSVTDTFSF